GAGLQERAKDQAAGAADERPARGGREERLLQVGTAGDGPGGAVSAADRDAARVIILACVDVAASFPTCRLAFSWGQTSRSAHLSLGRPGGLPPHESAS